MVFEHFKNYHALRYDIYDYLKKGFGWAMTDLFGKNPLCTVWSPATRGEPCPQGNCLLCLTGEGGGGLHHHRSGAVYRGECRICFTRIEGSLLSRYTGESGFSAYCRTQDHQKAIENKDNVNAFSKHLMIHHPDQVGNVYALKFSLLELHKQPSQG